ncbi:uncharacterized protein KIAA1614 homolog [Apus apus]|uniref:uncharacterized protein KIAA1614 homolog n=1 Tax=Apus apus TaxID=8895 RepID=UPI0021F8CAEC|nr:uncharacterized protein KIAA1614 homolog [Apus apus]
MEGGSPAEMWQAPLPPVHPGQGPAPPEHPEATRSPHAILESKVKALKEKRGASQPGTPTAAPERHSPKKPRPRRGKTGSDVATVEPRAQLRTYLTDGLLDSGDTAAGGPPAPRASTPGLWRVPAPRADMLGGAELSRNNEGNRSRGSAFSCERSPMEDEAWDQGGPSGSPSVAEGWERLSLAERVERNRQLLQEVLGLAVPEVPASDGDWDSGVSLQDAESCRALVPGQELQLSPRHEQAKQLLQRARMKARTNPLRASHDILLLPTALPPPREPSGRPSISPRDGGSLSDSSSGESSCGRPRRPRGPSPSRVRFEDESARDAEVRYLERLQLRHRRALGSALPWPEPAVGGRPGVGAGQPKGRSGNPVAGGKCSACGSFLGAAVSRGTDTPAGTDVAESSPVAPPGSIPGDTGGLSAARPELKPRALGPRGSPLWILPSRQRIHTEKIKETYIGDVTYIDEVDSALESTDTSDGCRTDSEEAGPRSTHPREHRDPRARGHRASRAAPPLEARAGKETCVATGGPRAGGGGSCGAPSRTGAVCPLPPGRAGSQEDRDHPPQQPGGREVVANTAHPLEQPGASTPMRGTHLPTPPPTKKACSQVPCRKTLFGGSRRALSQGSRGLEPKDGSSVLPQPGGEAGPGEQRGPCSPRWLPGSPLRALSTNNCNNTRGQEDTLGTGKGAPSQPIVPTLQEAARPPGEAAGTPGAQQPQHLAGSMAQGHVVDDHPPSEPREPGRPASRKGSSASVTGLKKLLCSLSQSTKQRLGRFRCYSMEQLPAPGSPSPGGPTMKKSPSLQSLQLVSPFCQPQKAASIQSLHPLLGKAPRASAYLLPQTPADRKGSSGPRRSLSVEDIGVPGQLHTVGRVVEVFPDGTSQLELQRPPHGAFGFCVTSGHGRPDTGVYVQEMVDAGTAKLYAGLLGVGDEILQVNGAAVSGLGLDRIRELLLQADTLSLRVLRHRPAPR